MGRFPVTHFGSLNLTTAYEYDDAGGLPLRVAAVTYPTGYTLRRRYDANTGNLVGLADSNNHLLWETEDANALGQVTRYRMGDIAGTRTYSRLTNRLEGILEKNGEKIIQDFTYTYDNFANLASRNDNRTNMTEDFTYDGLNRLTGIWLNGKRLGRMAYDVHGRMLGKRSDGRTVFSEAVYAQGSFENMPHAIRSAQVAANPFPASQQNVSYTMFDKAASITQGGVSSSGGEAHERSASFRYGFDHERMAMEETMDGAAWRSKVYAGHCEYVNGPNNNRSLTYLSGPLGVFAVYEQSGPYYLDEESGWDASLHYVLKDHLGSWTTVTDKQGNVEQRLSFDAWGNLRDPETWSGGYSGTLMFDRGFTGHEHLYGFGLINMNGRMYDPVMSGFLSPDNYIQAPDFSQSFNRYAYCLNNPLKYVD
ncbi:RHS repeat domain-containing protein, partial [Bacteroides heparinolyticus]|uniref:RHS repeat domain-containing protein n=1 Tax=Prevotella heparinolytica TaxID=28113 RepID=UPI0035A05761